MSKEHKTSEEILKKRFDANSHIFQVCEANIKDAIEEYAYQFKSALEERERKIDGLKSSYRIIEDALETVGLLLKDRDAELSTLRAENEELKSQPIDVDGNWISVDERLPEDNERVIVSIPHYIITTIAEYQGDRRFVAVNGIGCYEPFDYTNKVTHWQPLPNPPIK